MQPGIGLQAPEQAGQAGAAAKTAHVQAPQLHGLIIGLMASSTLSPPRRAALDSLTADLQAIFRNRLRAVCAYGLDNRDEQDLHTIAFVDQLVFDDLAACAPR